MVGYYQTTRDDNSNKCCFSNTVCNFNSPGNSENPPNVLTDQFLKLCNVTELCHISHKDSRFSRFPEEFCFSHEMALFELSPRQPRPRRDKRAGTLNTAVPQSVFFLTIRSQRLRYSFTALHCTALHCTRVVVLNKTGLLFWVSMENGWRCVFAFCQNL